MENFLITNLTYISLRLFVSSNVILLISYLLEKIIPKTYSYYISVLIMAQLSFWYDYFIFQWYFK